MFVINKTRFKRQHDRKGKTMATKDVTKKSTDKVGQMYEERKKDGTGRIGVIEEVDEKFKTYMMRDKDGNTFNITFSTLKSNWRKYTGEELIQTSSQIEEQKEEEAKVVEDADKEIKKVSNKTRISTEEKVKRLRAVDTLVTNMIHEKNSNLRVSRKAKGAIVVSYKKTALFEIWEKYNVEKFDFAIREDLVAMDRDDFDHVIQMTEYEYLEKWVLKHRCRIATNKFSDVLSAILDIAIKYETMRNESDEVNNRNKKEKADKKEEE